VKAVVDAMEKLREASGENRDKIQETLKDKANSDEEFEKVLEEVREARRELEKALRNARNKLREVLSYKQELGLLEQGILE
jgi:uncharacterized membrane protein